MAHQFAASSEAFHAERRNPSAVGREQRFSSSIRGENQIRIIVIDHFVDLPEIEMIGLQTAQGFLEHNQRQARIAAVRAGF